MILNYIIPYLKRFKIFESYFSFKFRLISALFYLFLVLLSVLYLTISMYS